VSPCRPPRVALVLGGSTGGIGRHVASAASGLRRRGAAVTVLGPQATDDLFGFSRSGALHVPVELAAAPRPLPAARALAALRRALRSPGFDVVHAHGLRAGLVAGLAAPSRLPLVVTWHNAPLADSRAFRALERAVARRADVVLTASPDLLGRAWRAGSRDARLSEVAAPSRPRSERSAAEIRAEIGVAPGQPLLLAVARLHRQKGLDVLLAAAQRWAARRPQPVVAVAGAGPLEAELRALAARGAAPVRFLGPREDVPDLLVAADVVVLPSRWEARALVAQEALAAGRPLVASSVGGLPGLVGDGALLVPSGDAHALATAVAGLLDDPAAAEALAARGRARAATWPGEEHTVRQLAAVYAELTGLAAQASP
jgi:glycosyltransferase involved in cell wall biosynthesis